MTCGECCVYLLKAGMVCSVHLVPKFLGVMTEVCTVHR